MKKKLLTVCLMCLLATALFASGSKEKNNGYTFATDATWPPLEYVENGELTGFEVELVPLIGQAVDVEMKAKNIPWETIFAGLANGAYDGIASGVTVTEERKATMAFSQPILNVGQVVIIPTKSEGIINSVNDLKGKKVGVQIGTTGDFALDTYDVKKKQYDDIGLAIEDMLNNNLDACVCDSLIASDFVLANENYSKVLTIAGDKFTEEIIAIAVKKNNTELLDLINEGLTKIKEDGSFDELKAKWNLL